MVKVTSVLDGDRLALSRLLTQIENDSEEGRQTLNKLFPHTGKAHLIGVTGPPGTGKSSLVNQIARYYRKRTDDNEPRSVAVVAVDPTSPFSGGAILGDRVRMRDLAGDEGVFIRSMASRGSLGGLAKATSGLVQALDAAGFETIIIETVGAGQAEVDIARLAHTTLVIETPGFGDDIQAIKAGILEIADILVVNKSDHPGADNTEMSLRSMLQLAQPEEGLPSHLGSRQKISAQENKEEKAQQWVPPIVRTVATEGSGISGLVKAISAHYGFLKETGLWQVRERARMQSELDMLLRSTLVNRWRDSVENNKYQEVLKSLVCREISLWQAVNVLIDGGSS